MVGQFGPIELPISRLTFEFACHFADGGIMFWAALVEVSPGVLLQSCLEVDKSGG